MVISMWFLIGGIAAWAQATESGQVPTLNAQLFRPSLDSQKTIWTDDARFDDEGLSGRVIASWTHAPLVYRADSGEEIVYIDDLLQTNLLGSMTWERLRVGIDAPLYLRSFSNLSGNETSLGDLSADARVGLIERQTGLALSGRVTLPTASTLSPLGDSATSYAAHVIVDRRLGDVLLAANLGAQLSSGTALENIAWDDRLVARLGAGWDLNDRTGTSLDLSAQMALSDPENPAGRPAELMLGGWRDLEAPLTIRAGIGTGLNSSIGSPQARMVAEVAYRPPRDPEPLLAPAVVYTAPEPVPAPDPLPAATALDISVFVYFDVDSAQIRPADDARLARAAEKVRAAGACGLQVDGYTDYTGGNSYNVDLSVDRAEAVVGALIDYGVPRRCIAAASHGETDANPDAVPVERQEDRRVSVRSVSSTAP